MVITVSREELHALVWSTPMVRLAERFGLSGNGLAKICRRLDVRYPPRGWWAKKAAGHKLRPAALHQAVSGTPTAARIAASEKSDEASGPDLNPLIRRIGNIEIPERLAKAHPVIAGWRSERKGRRAQAREDSWFGGHYVPPDFTPMEKSCQRALHALLKVVEHHGATVAASDRVGRVIVTVDGSPIELEIREKLKRVKRPMTADEQRWRSDPDRLITENVGSGRLHVVIHTWSNAGFRREWLESDAQPIGAFLPHVAATVLAMGPHLAALRRQREGEERVAAERRRQAEEERRRRKVEANRWGRFVEFARASEEVRQARALVVELRAQGSTAEEIAGKTIADWLDWAEERANAVDPLQRGAAALFGDIAEVTEWTYRE